MNYKFISELYIKGYILLKVFQRSIHMKKTMTRSRKELTEKMGKIFADRIESLSVSMQKILIDDMVTAFENRVEVLKRTQSNTECYVELGMKIQA
jgi:hypothetical protein